jgi:multicomponent Na+:H+ antiporter subunit F
VIYGAAALAILAALTLALIRALLGPTLFDRALAANSIGTSVILLQAILGFLTGRPEFLDVGILYALLNLIATLAVLRFFRPGDPGDDNDAKAAS